MQTEEAADKAYGGALACTERIFMVNYEKRKMEEMFFWDEVISILKNVYWGIIVRGKNVLNDQEDVKKYKLTNWEGFFSYIIFFLK